MIERYDEAARAKGVVLIPSSGFDSIPSDMACQWMAERVAVRFGKPARRVSAYVAMQGGMSGGTVLSGILSEEAFGRSRLADPAALSPAPTLAPTLALALTLAPILTLTLALTLTRSRLADPYLLGPPRRGEARREDADVSEALWDGTVGGWTAPFAMAQINTRIVYAAQGSSPNPTPNPNPKPYVRRTGLEPQASRRGPRQVCYPLTRLSLASDRRRSVGLLTAAAPAAAARLYSADFTYTERAVAPDEARATKRAQP